MMTVCAAVVIIIGGPPYHTIQLLVDHYTIPYNHWWTTIPYHTIRLLEGHHTHTAQRWSATKLMKRQPYAAVALANL